MQKKDRILAGILGAAFAFLLLWPGAMDSFISMTAASPLIMSFLKFAVLATIGECIALRITTGVYNRPGFGIAPKFVLWGLLGVACKLVFSIYGAGTPSLLRELGFALSPDRAAWGFGHSFLAAFSISVLLNTLFAPILMVGHKIGDIHIERTGGTLAGFFSRPDMAALFNAVNWDSMWSFVLKKTVPMFWIPAHTITFLLPAHFQVLFAAVLSIALGVILAFAGLRAKKAA
jgi:Mpv17 / PMP22 family.